MIDDTNAQPSPDAKPAPVAKTPAPDAQPQHPQAHKLVRDIEAALERDYVGAKHWVVEALARLKSLL